MLKVDASLGRRVSGLIHTLTVVAESVSQVNCNQGICVGADDGGVKSVKMVAYCLSVMLHAHSLLYQQIIVGQPDFLSPSQHSLNHDHWSLCACSSHISSRKSSCSDFFIGITYELWVALP